MSDFTNFRAVHDELTDAVKTSTRWIMTLAKPLARALRKAECEERLGPEEERLAA